MIRRLLLVVLTVLWMVVAILGCGRENPQNVDQAIVVNPTEKQENRVGSEEKIPEALGATQINNDLQSETSSTISSEIDSIPFVYTPKAGGIDGEAGAEGCSETILNYKLSGYSYHMPYAYWFKNEGWADDLMLEYAYWTNDGKKRPKAFYISDYWLYLAIKNCGVVVYWEAMEGKKQRVTAEVGKSIWGPYGVDRVRYNTILGFRVY